MLWQDLGRTHLNLIYQEHLFCVRIYGEIGFKWTSECPLWPWLTLSRSCLNSHRMAHDFISYACKVSRLPLVWWVVVGYAVLCEPMEGVTIFLLISLNYISESFRAVHKLTPSPLKYNWFFLILDCPCFRLFMVIHPIYEVI